MLRVPPVVERLPTVEPTKRHVFAPVPEFVGHVFSIGVACLLPLLGGGVEEGIGVGLGVA